MNFITLPTPPAPRPAAVSLPTCAADLPATEGLSGAGAESRPSAPPLRPPEVQLVAPHGAPGVGSSSVVTCGASPELSRRRRRGRAALVGPNATWERGRNNPALCFLLVFFLPFLVSWSQSLWIRRHLIPASLRLSATSSGFILFFFGGVTTTPDSLAPPSGEDGQMQVLLPSITMEFTVRVRLLSCLGTWRVELLSNRFARAYAFGVKAIVIVVIIKRRSCIKIG